MPIRHGNTYRPFGWLVAVCLFFGPALAQEPQEVVPTALEGQPVTEGGQATSEDGAADQGQKSEPAPENISPSLDKIEAAIRDLIAQERAGQGQGPKDEEIRDLEAQEGMALWAKAMFWATVAAVALTFAGIYLIWRTLKYTKIAAGHTEKMLTEARETTKAARDAVDEAKAATRAAEDVVDVTRITAERQLRAYVHIESALVHTTDKSGSRHISVSVKNFGQTPAVEYKMWAVVHVHEWPSQRSLEDQPDDLRMGIEPLPPGRTSILIIPVSDLSNREEGDLQAGRAGIYCWGKIDYLDIFNRRHVTKFHLVCEGEGLKNGYLHVCEDGNDAT